MTTSNDNTEYEESLADGPASGPFAHGLWRDARWCLYQAMNVFGSFEEIAGEGLNRKLGRQLATWIYMIEATVRRLILAAAFALGLGPIVLPIGKKKSGKTTRAPRAIRPRFLIFARHKGTAKRMNIVRQEPGFGDYRYRHAAFARDPLLSLGAPEPTAHKPRAKPATRRPVYARRKPLSRWDPNYRTRSDWEDALTRRTRLALARSRPKQKRHALTPEERAKRSLIYIAGDRLRAIEQREAQRLIPAPDLVRKLQALAHLMRDPAKPIASTARRLAHAAKLAQHLTYSRQPKLRRRRTDPGITPGKAMLDAACALWPPPAYDSS